MRALVLDYQRKPRARERLGWLMLLAGIVTVVMVGDVFVRVHQEKRDLEATLARVEPKRVPLVRSGSSQRESKRDAEEIKLANAVAERLTLPWVDLFQALEAGGTSKIALLALEPDAQKRILRITAEAKNKADMLAFVLKLTEDQRLINVHLMDHQLQAQTPGQPVRFSVQASWAALSKREEH